MLPGLVLPSPVTNEYDLVGAQANFDLADLAPAALPAWVIRDRRVEPGPRAPLGSPVAFENPLVGLVVGRLGEGSSRVLAIDAVAGPEGLHAGRARPEGARDPLVAPALVHPALYVVYELP